MNEELKKQAEELGIIVDGRWSDVTLRQKINEALLRHQPLPEQSSPPIQNPLEMKPMAKPPVGEAKPPTMFPVKLLKNYAPRSMNFKVIYEAPPPLPGVHFVSKDKSGKVIGVKLWADTVVELPRDEANALLDNEAVSQDPRIGPDGKVMRNAAGDIMRQIVRRKFPLAERADPRPS